MGTEITQTTSKTQTTTLAEFGYENIIAAHILSGYNISAIDTTSLLKDTHAQQDILLDVRLDMLSATAPIMPSPILSVDYAPYIRQLVKRDDEEARMMEANSIASNRGTRNSSRNLYRRMYDYDCVPSIQNSYFRERQEGEWRKDYYDSKGRMIHPIHSPIIPYLINA